VIHLVIRVVVGDVIFAIHPIVWALVHTNSYARPQQRVQELAIFAYVTYMYTSCVGVQCRSPLGGGTTREKYEFERYT